MATRHRKQVGKFCPLSLSLLGFFSTVFLICIWIKFGTLPCSLHTLDNFLFAAVVFVAGPWQEENAALKTALSFDSRGSLEIPSLARVFDG